MFFLITFAMKSFSLVVFSCLISPEAFPIPDLSNSVARHPSPYFVANIVKSIDDSAYQLNFVSTSLKLFLFLTKLFDFGSNPIFREKFPKCSANIVLPSWDKFQTNMLRICAYLSLTHSKLTSSKAFLAVVCCLQQLQFIFCPDKTIVHLLFVLGVLQKLKN